jgi:hypothetical protein
MLRDETLGAGAPAFRDQLARVAFKPAQHGSDC